MLKNDQFFSIRAESIVSPMPKTPGFSLNHHDSDDEDNDDFEEVVEKEDNETREECAPEAPEHVERKDFVHIDDGGVHDDDFTSITNAGE